MEGPSAEGPFSAVVLVAVIGAAGRSEVCVRVGRGGREVNVGHDGVEFQKVLMGEWWCMLGMI